MGILPALRWPCRCYNWARKFDTVRNLAALFEDMSGDNLPAKRMTEAMDAYARTRGIEMIDRLDLSETRRLLDLGCGPGTYSLAIVERWPHVRATLLDLPGPIAEARASPPRTI